MPPGDWGGVAGTVFNIGTGCEAGRRQGARGRRRALLITGGVLLDLDRVAAAREALDKVAHVAAFEAAATAKPTERKAICQKRFAKTVWTDTEVSIDDLDVSVVPTGRGNMAS